MAILALSLSPMAAYAYDSADTSTADTPDPVVMTT